MMTQGKDGCLSTYYVDERAKRRFTDFRGGHGIVLYGPFAPSRYRLLMRATGERRLLDAGITFAAIIRSLRWGREKKPALPIILK